ncbi:hypothetical protein FOPG_17353, partial [Fusarium oxysporum f. sp. conglutinans race 2 54008]
MNTAESCGVLELRKWSLGLNSPTPRLFILDTPNKS